MSRKVSCEKDMTLQRNENRFKSKRRSGFCEVTSGILVSILKQDRGCTGNSSDRLIPGICGLSSEERTDWISLHLLEFGRARQNVNEIFQIMRSLNRVMWRECFLLHENLEFRIMV